MNETNNPSLVANKLNAIPIDTLLLSGEEFHFTSIKHLTDKE